MKVRFLLDENLSPRLKLALVRLNPTIDVLRVGDAAVPPLETSDLDLLRYLHQAQRLFISRNRKSMPGHLNEFWAEGGQHWGVLWVRPHTSIGILAQDLHLLWQASEAEEWQNRLEWLPF